MVIIVAILRLLDYPPRSHESGAVSGQSDNEVVMLKYLFGRGRKEVKKSSDDLQKALNYAKSSQSEIDDLRTVLRTIQEEIKSEAAALTSDCPPPEKAENEQREDSDGASIEYSSRLVVRIRPIGPPKGF